MTPDALHQSALSRGLTDFFADLSDLVHKELRLARAELTRTVTTWLQASVWLAVAVVLSVVAALLIVEGVVFAVASMGLALHWSCFVVAVVLAAAAGLAFYYGRASAAAEPIAPRATRQFNEVVRTAKEQLR